MFKNKLIYLMFLSSVVMVDSCMAKTGKTSVCSKARPVEIIGHRGASFDAPENTVASAKLAWKMGTQAVECDIYLSKDNRIMVIHDPNVERTAGGVKLMVKDTNSAELRKLDFGSFKAAKYAGEKIPFLEELIDTIPAKRKLFVEIKCGAEIIPHLQKMFDGHKKRKQIVIIGFGLETVAQAKKAFPDIPVYWLVYPDENEKTKQLIPYSADLITQAKANSLDGLDVYYRVLNMEFVQQVHNAGMKIYVWTVDEPNDVKQMRQIGVDGITTNRPNLFLK
jgi:glycerophosphoryl diester phosphodiesterase